MPTPLIAQEIYLLERFSSLESLADVRDAWEAMLKHVEGLYERFMLNLPPDYRRRPLPQQPDKVWGDLVLPNFRDSMQVLNESVIERSHGDLWAIGGAAIESDVHGQRDYSSDWMDEVEPGGAARYYELLFHASDLATPPSRTWSGIWSPGALTTDYDKVIKLPLNPPASWPIYRLSPTVKMRSGERTPKSGIYLPDVEGAFPTLLFKRDSTVSGTAREALALKTQTNSERHYVPCAWTLVERVADSGGSAGWGDNLSSSPTRRPNVPAGQPCPEAGWWFTPVQSGSRRYFKQGDAMPSLGGDYGETFWQWSQDQSAPKL